MTKMVLIRLVACYDHETRTDNGSYNISPEHRVFSTPNSPSSTASANTINMSDGQEPVEPSLTPEEANRIIHSHRKVRYGKLCDSPNIPHVILVSVPHRRFGCEAIHPSLLNHDIGTACWPCRQRKVKCDNKQPCENCVKRDHANLCSYNPKNAHKTSGSVVGVKRARSRSPESDNSLKKVEDRWPRTTGKLFLFYQFF